MTIKIKTNRTKHRLKFIALMEPVEQLQGITSFLKESRSKNFFDHIKMEQICGWRILRFSENTVNIQCAQEGP